MNTREITLGQVAATFAPFGLAVTAAMMAAEAALDVPFQRLIYSVWAAMALMTPALALYILPRRTAVRWNYWLLLWTFAYGAYLFHFYYSVVVHYHGSVAEVFSKQGLAIAGSNFLVTIWWGVDVALAWAVKEQRKWISVERALLTAFLPVTFFIASVVIFKGFVNVLGYAMTAVVVMSVWLRLRATWAGEADAVGGGR